MDLVRLRYFVTVADTGHIGRAAELLHLSQPALSRSMRALAGELGVELLRPSGRGIALTAEGRRLAERVRPILGELAELRHDIHAQGGAGRPLRLGSHETFATVFLAIVARHAGGSSLEHHALAPDEIPDALRKGAIDVGVSYLPVAGPGVSCREAGRIAISIWGRPRFLDVPFEDLPFAAPARRVLIAGGAAIGLDAWPDPMVGRRVPFRVSHTHAALELARAGAAVAFIADFVVSGVQQGVSADEQLVRIPMPAQLPDHRQGVYVTTRIDEQPAGIAPVLRAIADVEVTPRPRPRGQRRPTR